MNGELSVNFRSLFCFILVIYSDWFKDRHNIRTVFCYRSIVVHWTSELKNKIIGLSGHCFPLHLLFFIINLNMCVTQKKQNLYMIHITLHILRSKWIQSTFCGIKLYLAYKGYLPKKYRFWKFLKILLGKYPL